MSDFLNTKIAIGAEQNSCYDTQLSDSQIDLIKKRTKYRDHFPDLLEKHLEQNSFCSFTAVVKVKEATLYAWIDAYPEFAAVRERFRKPKPKLYPVF